MRNYANDSIVRQVKRRTKSSSRWPRQARRTQFGTRDYKEPFSPPEDWHEPHEEGGAYKIVVQAPGDDYHHVLTPEQIRARLAQVPRQFVEKLEVVQLCRMTRKKQSFPCYGMQWGATIYLYPIEASLEEHFPTPPSPNVVNEARMYGGRWDNPTHDSWRLTWSERAIEDFYLNNILIHELGHLVDERNTGYNAREQYAEWFAIEYGYRATGGSASRRSRPVRRRHHKK